MSNETVIITALSLLVGLLGWNGSQAHKRLDKIEESMHSLIKSMPNDFLGKTDFRSYEERMEKRIDRIEKTIETAFHEFWRKFDAVMDRLQGQIENKQDRK